MKAPIFAGSMFVHQLKRGRAIRLALPIVVFSATAAWLYLPHILFLGPCGIHFIRQTDSIAFMMNYGHTSWNFFNPSIYSLREAPVDGHAVAEFPLLYYIAALGRSVFGFAYTSLRSMHLLFVIAGHVLLARTAARWLGSIIAGTFFSLWMFSSSVVVYYAANYLPDAAAYGLVLCGLCMVIDDLDHGKTRHSGIGIWLLTLAGLLKAPASLYLIATTGTIFLLNRLHWNKENQKRVIWGCIGMVVCLCWHLYAILYNNYHHTHYFMTWAEPIWSMSTQSRESTWQFVFQYWWTKYHHPTTWHLFAVLLFTGIFLARRIPLQVRVLMGFLLPAFIAYGLLFFRKFADHDYYFLTIAPIIALGIMASLSAIRGLATRRWQVAGLAGLMVILSIMGMTLARTNLDRRYSAPDAFTVSTVLENKILPVFADQGIPLTSKVVVLGDPSPDGALLFMERKGWAYGPKDRLPPLDSLIGLGATQLLVLGPTGTKCDRFKLLKEQDNWRLFSLDQ
jgi:4-amino-4-deoxy-L-arabinose transferase-like glycosyltransferase